MTAREHIKFGLVRTEEAFQSLMKFAESFDHKVGRDSLLPIWTIERGDQTIGYFNVLFYPVIAPAMHPRLTSPRDFYEAIYAVRSHFCMNSISEKFPNGTCFFALPTEEIVPDSIFEKCGFRNTHKELWQCIP